MNFQAIYPICTKKWKTLTIDTIDNSNKSQKYTIIRVRGENENKDPYERRVIDHALIIDDKQETVLCVHSDFETLNPEKAYKSNEWYCCKNKDLAQILCKKFKLNIKDYRFDDELVPQDTTLVFLPDNISDENQDVNQNKDEKQSNGRYIFIEMDMFKSEFIDLVKNTLKSNKILQMTPKVEELLKDGIKPDVQDVEDNENNTQKNDHKIKE